MTMRTAYVNGRVLDCATAHDGMGGVLVRDGVIEDWGAQVTADNCGRDSAIVDCEGHCLAAGLIDMQVSVREHEESHKETIFSALSSAARGGVTAVVATADTEPVVDHAGMVGFMERKAREAKKSKLYPTAALTQGREGHILTDMGLLQEAGVIAFGDGERMCSVKTLYNAMLYSRAHDALLFLSLQEASFGHGVMNEGFLATHLGVEGIPSFTEAMVLERIIRLVRETGARVHVNLVTTAESVSLLAAAKTEGLSLTAGTAPLYMWLTEDAVTDYCTAARVMPPLRQESDRQAVVQGVARGVIDVIVSAHEPQDSESKSLPFSQAAVGAVGLETLLPLSLRLYHEGHCSLLAWLACVTHNPATVTRLPLGGLHKGRAADMVCFDVNKEGVIDGASFVSLSHSTPFDGHKVKGAVRWTLVDGVMMS